MFTCTFTLTKKAAHIWLLSVIIRCFKKKKTFERFGPKKIWVWLLWIWQNVLMRLWNEMLHVWRVLSEKKNPRMFFFLAFFSEEPTDSNWRESYAKLLCSLWTMKPQNRTYDSSKNKTMKKLGLLFFSFSFWQSEKNAGSKRDLAFT